MEQICSPAAKINFPIPGLGVFYSMAYSGSEMKDVNSSIVLPTVALSSKKRVVSRRNLNSITMLLGFSLLAFLNYKYSGLSATGVLLLPSLSCGDDL